MANLRVKWVLPTTRQSGKPLPSGEVDFTRIELSADAGTNWTKIGDFPPATLETLIQDLDFGVWQVRGTVFDVAGRPSAPLVKEVTNADTTPPSVLSDLTLTLE